MDPDAMSPETDPLAPHALVEAWMRSGTPPRADTLRAAMRRLWDMDNRTRRRAYREAFTRRLGFAVPHPDAIEAIAALSPLVEVAAGTGYLTALLRHAGADAIASDLGDDRPYAFRIGAWCALDRADAAEMVRAHPDRTVLLSWPERAPWAAAAIDALARGQRLVLIGEECGGCCGTDAMFDTLDRVFALERDLPHLQFFDLHDTVTVWRRVG